MLLPTFFVALVVIPTVTCAELAAQDFVKPLLTAEFAIQPPLGPIPVPAGYRIIEPIPNGRVSGSINGTISSGLVVPTVLDPLSTPNFTSISETYLYGTIDGDGGPFYVQAFSVGVGGRSVARLIIEADGQYEYLQRTFVFARILSSLETGQVTLEAYTVDMP